MLVNLLIVKVCMAINTLELFSNGVTEQPLECLSGSLSFLFISTHKNDVFERNVCYLWIFKEGSLALQRNPSHCKFFPRAVISNALCVINAGSNLLKIHKKLKNIGHCRHNIGVDRHCFS